MAEMSIAERLITARGKRTQREVAEMIGISVSALGMYETGKRIPRDGIKKKLAQIYDVPVQDLFF